MARVLIVDDERAILHSTALLLNDLGHETATLDRASEIDNTLEAFLPDVLVQDVRMPGLDIEILIRRLRTHARWATLPVVLFTAGLEAVEIAEELGVPVIEKPFRPSELEEAISAARTITLTR